MATKSATCPHCKRRFQYDRLSEPSYLPFCCERCQWIDLGKWLTDEYRISKSLLADDDEQQD